MFCSPGSPPRSPAVRRPTPAAGWRSVPQALESEMETREAALAWAAAALETPSAAPAGERRRFEDAAFPANASSIDGKRAGPSGGTSAPSANAPPRVTKCHCGVPASVKEVFKEGKNQGRSFYACGTRGVSRFRNDVAKACSFFSWADDAPSSESARATRWRRFDPPRFRLSAEARGTNISASRFRPSDVRQGAVGDCWLLSALAVIAERADLVDRLVLPTRGESPCAKAAGDAVAARAHGAGAYFLRLFLDGKWQGLVVDSRLPVRGADTQVLRGANAAGSRRRKADADEFRPAYSRAAGNQLWVPLVEKAHAKAHGSYHAISGGWISEGLVDLTGCPTESLRLRGRVGAGSSERLDAIWARLLSYAAARFPMGCATHRGDAARGIVGGHAYSVMDVREVRGLTKGRQTTLGESRIGCSEIVAEEEAETARRSADETLRLVRVRNPWGRKEWNGEWGTGSEVWTKKLGAELGHVRADDGTFWMSFRDFVSRFSRVDVCVAREGWFVNSLEMASSGAAFELELEPGEPAASWAYVMAMQTSKRGRGSAGFWYDDWHVAVYARDEARGAWAHVAAAAGARERDAQTEVMFEPGVRYLVRAYSFARETRAAERRSRERDHRAAKIPLRTDAEPAATLRLYSARKLRARPAETAAGSPSLAPAIHAGMFDARAGPTDSADSAGPLVVERAAVRVCGGAVVVCRTRGGAHVFAVNASSAAELRVRLSVRARAGLADVYQHPAPRAPDDFREGARYRYVPRGEEGAGRRRGNADRTNQNQKHQKHQKLLWSEHAVPAGRARLSRWRWRLALPSQEGTRWTCAWQPSARRAPRARCARRGARGRNRTMKTKRARETRPTRRSRRVSPSAARPRRRPARATRARRRAAAALARPRPLRSRLATTTTTTTMTTTTMTAAIRWSLSTRRVRLRFRKKGMRSCS